MAKRSPSKQRYQARFQLHWIPVLRAVRELALTARSAHTPKGQSLLMNKEVKTAAKTLLCETRAWHADWQRHRIASGKGFKTPTDPLPPPKDHFHRLQRACKTYGHSLRPSANHSETIHAAQELINCALQVPTDKGVFSESYCSKPPAPSADIPPSAPPKPPFPQPQHTTPRQWTPINTLTTANSST